MCLIFLSINDHPKYKLVIAANRDEFYKRKTAAADFWNDYPEIVGGRDLEAMGTWMAMNKAGKIGMVTNYRDLKNINPDAPTRGLLVSDFLVNGYHPEDYLKDLHLKADRYNGFNLLIGTIDQLYYYSNYQSKIVQLKRGTYGLSNALLDTPWPKVQRGKQKFASVVNQDVIEVESLFEILRDETIAPDDQLPNTGLDMERERALSAMFIKTPNYGSRCSTVVLVDKDNYVSYVERVFNLETFDYQQQEFHFEAE